MANPTAKAGILERLQSQNPYGKMAQQAVDQLDMIQTGINALVERDRQVAARRRVADVTFVGVDQDPSLTFPIAGTYCALKVPNNMSWRCMRTAVTSAANDIIYMYRGAPNPQNIVERIPCAADGFYTDSFSNDIYMAGGALIIFQSSLATAGFHVQLEIERMVPYQIPVSTTDLHTDLVQTPGPATGADYDWPSVDPVEHTAIDRHENAVEESPDEQSAPSAEHAATPALIPDASLHLPGAHV